MKKILMLATLAFAFTACRLGGEQGGGREESYGGSYGGGSCVMDSWGSCIGTGFGGVLGSGGGTDGGGSGGGGGGGRSRSTGLLFQMESKLLSAQTSEMAVSDLQEKYGFTQNKAETVISALEAVSRDEISEQEAFPMVFGVEKADADVAIEQASVGNWNPLMELSVESAKQLEISSHALRRYVKDVLQ